jgi:phosphatidate cytidylyltransferase
MNYFSLGVFIIAKFPILGLWYPTINFLLNYHNVICCMLAIGLFVSFVISLKQGYLKYQFRLFGWIVMAMLLAIYQSWYLIHTTFEGIFFYIVPAFLIIVNDIFAYIFGYFFGKRQLIALSPKKTWEGYIGGAISTFFFTFVLTSALTQIPGITCPMI